MDLGHCETDVTQVEAVNRRLWQRGDPLIGTLDVGQTNVLNRDILDLGGRSHVGGRCVNVIAARECDGVHYRVAVYVVPLPRERSHEYHTRWAASS